MLRELIADPAKDDLTWPGGREGVHQDSKGLKVGSWVAIGTLRIVYLAFIGDRWPWVRKARVEGVSGRAHTV